MPVPRADPRAREAFCLRADDGIARNEKKAAAAVTHVTARRGWPGGGREGGEDNKAWRDYRAAHYRPGKLEIRTGGVYGRLLPRRGNAREARSGELSRGALFFYCRTLIRGLGSQEASARSLFAPVA